jgi:uncharacterized protein YaaQ
MKLLIAIVHQTDGEEMLPVLTAAGFGVTRIVSTGGFLRRRSAILLIGTRADQVAEATQIIREHSPASFDPALKRASVFVLNAERHERF